MTKILLTQSVIIEQTEGAWYIDYVGRQFKINETIATLLLILSEPKTFEEIVREISSEDYDNKDFCKNINTFLYEMHKLGIIRKEGEIDLKLSEQIFELNKIYGDYEFLILIALDDPFVQVYQVFNHQKSIFAVIKLFSHQQTVIQKEEKLKRPFQMFEQEFQIMSNLPEHKNICKFVKYSTLNGYPFAELEFIEGTTLSKRIRENTIPESKQIAVAVEILASMAHIHKNNVLHGDIHTRNFMITHDFQVKLIDFGFSFMLDNDQQIRNKGGLTHYMPPERVNTHSFKFSNTYSTKRAEVYQMGLVLLKLFTGKNPFLTKEERTWKEMAAHILRYECTEKISNSIVIESVIKKALSIDPNQRYADCGEMYADCKKRLDL